MGFPSNAPVETLPAYLRVQEAATHLRLNVKTVYAAIASGTLRHVRFGRTLRIPREALAALANGTPLGEPPRKKRGRRDS
jgi:excisionase family DNA binding protein